MPRLPRFADHPGKGAVVEEAADDLAVTNVDQDRRAREGEQRRRPAAREMQERGEEYGPLARHEKKGGDRARAVARGPAIADCLGQYGRALCMERVCQGGSILVVGGPLKK